MIREKHVYSTPDDLAGAAATRIVEILVEALASRPKASLVLTGGRTPRLTYRRLAEHHHDAIDWHRVALFWGDERFVPHDHPESNYGMAKESLLRNIEVADAFPIPTDHASPSASAEHYERDILGYFANREPLFDLTLLGLGDDAHVASLFPGAPELEERERLVVPAQAPPEHAARDRISLTFPALNASKCVLFLVAGENKRGAVRQALSGDDVPAAHVAPREHLLWYLDAEAAGAMK